MRACSPGAGARFARGSAARFAGIVLQGWLYEVVRVMTRPEGRRSRVRLR